MMSYEEYRKKVYELFLKRCLTHLSEQDKLRYLDENEKFIQESYQDDLYRFNEMGMDKVFTDTGILAGVCDNLEKLW